MIEIDKLVSAICSKIPEGSSFEPAETSLNNYFPEAPKDEQEEISPINFNELEKQIPIAISPRYPIEDLSATARKHIRNHWRQSPESTALSLPEHSLSLL